MRYRGPASQPSIQQSSLFQITSLSRLSPHQSFSFVVFLVFDSLSLVVSSLHTLDVKSTQIVFSKLKLRDLSRDGTGRDALFQVGSLISSNRGCA